MTDAEIIERLNMIILERDTELANLKTECDFNDHRLRLARQTIERLNCSLEKRR